MFVGIDWPSPAWATRRLDAFLSKIPTPPSRKVYHRMCKPSRRRYPKREAQTYTSCWAINPKWHAATPHMAWTCRLQGIPMADISEAWINGSWHPPTMALSAVCMKWAPCVYLSAMGLAYGRVLPFAWACLHPLIFWYCAAPHCAAPRKNTATAWRLGRALQVKACQKTVQCLALGRL